MLSFLFPLMVPLCVWFGVINGPQIIVTKYSRWKQLNTLVATQNPNSPWKTAWISACMVLETMWINTLQTVNNSVRRVNRTQVEVTYSIDGKIYRMITYPARGPCPVLSVTTEKGEDVTESVMAYFGPRRDWHHCHFTPKFFGHKQLTFSLAAGHEKIFDENEVISFSSTVTTKSLE